MSSAKETHGGYADVNAVRKWLKGIVSFDDKISMRYIAADALSTGTRHTAAKAHACMSAGGICDIAVTIQAIRHTKTMAQEG